METGSRLMNDDSPLAQPGRSITKQVVGLAWPVFLEQSLLYLVGLSDTLLTGRYLTAEHLAAVTVSGYLLWFLGSLIAVVSVGATALVARSIGANERARAVRVCQQAMLMAVVLGFVLLAAGWLSAPWLVARLELTGRAAASAVTFLRIVLTVTPLLTCTLAGVACLRGAGDTRTGLWVMSLVNLINVVLSWSFVRGYGPFPELGFPGVALGTAVGEGVGGLVILGVLSRGRSGLRIEMGAFRPDWSLIRRMLRVSVPAAGESVSNILFQLWFLALINRLGAVATAAHGVAIRCEAIAFLTVTAFSVAASTLTGQYLGAERPDLASRAARTAWGLGVVVLALMGVGLFVFAEGMFGIFLGGRQPEVALEGVPVLRVVSIALPALATINVLNGAFRGAGDTRWPLLFVFAGYLLVRLPLTYQLTAPTSAGGAGLGLHGAWLAMFADLHARALLVAGRFLQGGWKRVRV